MANKKLMLSLLESITKESFRTPLLAFFNKNSALLDKMPGAISHHHNWDGGWTDHTTQVMQFATELYERYKVEIGTAFDRDDVIIVAFAHDLDKLSRYKEAESKWAKEKGYKWEFNKDNAPYEETSKAIVESLRNGIMLTDAHVEAINHHHGGFSADMASVYKGAGRMTKLSTLLHCADMLSAYLFGQLNPNVV